MEGAQFLVCKICFNIDITPLVKDVHIEKMNALWLVQCLFLSVPWTLTCSPSMYAQT